MPATIKYSDKYFDTVYEYRHVILPPEKVKMLPKPLRVLSEDEWRALGVQQSRGWEHYAVHKPEPQVLLFRRLLAESPDPPAEWVEQQKLLKQGQVKTTQQSNLQNQQNQLFL